MKLSTLLTINAIVVCIFGFVFLIIPASTLSLYGLTADNATIVMSQLFGGALFGYGVVAWFARNAEESRALRAIVLGYFMTSVLGTVVALKAQLTGKVNLLGWSTVIIYLLFAIGYGYSLFTKPKES